jgi:hypothetical protein
MEADICHAGGSLYRRGIIDLPALTDGAAEVGVDKHDRLRNQPLDLADLDAKLGSNRRIMDPLEEMTPVDSLHLWRHSGDRLAHSLGCDGPVDVRATLLPAPGCRSPDQIGRTDDGEERRSDRKSAVSERDVGPREEAGEAPRD